MHELLMLAIEGTVFAVPTSYLVEVLPAVALSSMPLQPDYISGLMNLRGEVLAIHDMRRHAGLKAKEMEETDKIVVASDGKIKLGILVDKIEAVQRFKEEQLFAQSLSPRAFRIIELKDRNVHIKDLQDYLDD
ncbi:MAG: chemotaxis protein CheW [Candidatus Melainabacteria bacterium]|nr:chemotaxis protein CheW [Candidatus Melainabacteria bacterium]